MTIPIETSSITVTFNPDISLLSEQLKAIQDSCNIIIVDNGSTAENFDQLTELIGKYDKIEFVALGENTGIAYAQNEGIDRARTCYPDTTSILLLDQDSTPNADMIYRLKNSLAMLGEKFVSAVGPSLIDQFTGTPLGFHQISGFRYKRVCPSSNQSNPIEICNINSSGLLIDVKALDIAGGFENDFFIDHVETEWCYRATSLGVRLYGIPDAEMQHQMGENSIKYWFFGERTMPYRKPIRHYYLFRNSLVLQHRSYVPTTWKIWNIAKLIFTFLYFTLFSRERSEQLKQMRRGIADGIKRGRKKPNHPQTRS
jgi:rhamnosyltransferase